MGGTADADAMAVAAAAAAELAGPCGAPEFAE